MWARAVHGADHSDEVSESTSLSPVAQGSPYKPSYSEDLLEAAMELPERSRGVARKDITAVPMERRQLHVDADMDYGSVRGSGSEMHFPAGRAEQQPMPHSEQLQGAPVGYTGDFDAIDSNHDGVIDRKVGVIPSGPRVARWWLACDVAM